MLKKLHLRKLLFSVSLALLIGVASASAESWKFGVMSDTQWKTGTPDPVNCPNGDTKNCDGKNPNSVAVGIINELNRQFIAHKVKFVIQTGDLTDNGSVAALDTTATFMQALYNAGIGFYPLRGNHESSQAAAVEFGRIFPQIATGLNNQTPANAQVATPFYGPPPANDNTTFVVGSNFSSPASDPDSYSFDYENARFLLLDQFTPPSGTSHSVLNASDVDWTGFQLSNRPPSTHAFVFGHKHLISENHTDTLFGNDPSANPSGLQDLFIAHLYNNGVHYYMGGHDHMHNRALVSSPDGTSMIQNIITASNSYKFYIPLLPSNDEKYNIPAREVPIAQELFTIGYYIVTVDGPQVTVDFYCHVLK
jgi:3',5'-cyclic AMP phosphodiesterase CpdA